MSVNYKVYPESIDSSNKAIIKKTLNKKNNNKNSNNSINIVEDNYKKCNDDDLKKSFTNSDYIYNDYIYINPLKNMENMKKQNHTFSDNSNSAIKIQNTKIKNFSDDNIICIKKENTFNNYNNNNNKSYRHKNNTCKLIFIIYIKFNRQF